MMCAYCSDMQQALDLCPFCGGEARKNAGHELDAGHWCQYVCTECGARTDKYPEWQWRNGKPVKVDAEKMAIAAWNRRADGWISVKDRPPEPITRTSGFDVKNTYLVARFENSDPEGYFYGYELAQYWSDGKWRSVNGAGGLSVTHWMPLSLQPPEGDPR
jgi:Lar family restriction alleviation protein